MDWYEIKCDSKRSVKFPDKVSSAHVASPTSKNAHVNKIGGIIKKGQWAWLAKGSTIQIVSLKNGHTMSTFEFAESNGYDNCVIKCADELFPHNVESVYLAICLECMNSTGGSFIAIYSVDHSTVLSCMEVKLRVTSCRFMESTVCKRSLLQNFDGCLALGSMEGALVLLDLNIRKMLALHEQQIVEDVFIPCHVMDYNMPLREIHRNFKQCKQDGVHFGLQMEVIDAPCSVQCLLPIDLIMALAVGYEDGRLALYDLTELQIFYIAMPQQQEATTPLIKMDFLEPPDDPRPCLYIWALHENEDSLTAVLHSLMYEKRFIDNDESGFCFFETFQSSTVRLVLPLDNSRSIAVSCQAIKKSATHDADDSSCLCALSWYAESEEINKLLIFDLNQWYKEEMPFMLDVDKKANFLASYILSGSQCALQSYVNPSTIAYFNSMQRFEEHFYPSSLSFDCTLLMQDSCLSFNWEGAQNRFISTLRSSNATIFLDPNTYFAEIIHTRLMPQFCELNAKATFSTNAKYEIILSVALEYNCFSLLRDCAKCWVDGSFTGTFSTTTGITLSTLTNWVWKRATDIKTRCNDLCKGLFDFDGYPLDQRELKEFGFISRQLKLLSDLLDEVLTFSKQNVPEKVFSNLEHKYKSLRMATDYQDILMWLLNIGLLPEASTYSCKMNSSIELVPYPYRFLKEIYAKKRAFFGKICENFVSKKTGSCRLIYIDAYIQHECKGSVLREYWLENNGDGLYPPTSIESMLRIMLVPDVSFESKCAILLYFFLDLNMAINDDAYKHVVANFIKFPSVFKLSASLIKTVQAFWNLDHGHFLPAVDEFISPFNKNQKYPEWVLELLIEALLMQDSSNLTLRILEAHSTLISPVLKLQALLANELISEAFHFARSKQDDTLLEQFFESCLIDGKFGVIRDLALSEKEDQLVQDILKRSKTQNAENLHFVYLLQKSKYIEAVSYMDEISKAKCMRSNLNNTAINTPNLVMSAYNTTMTPVTQGLTDVYFRIKNKIRKKETDNKSPVPLSCQLIKQNANNLLGGIYHSSALSAHFATYYWGEIDSGGKKNEVDNNLLNTNNAPFLRKPQVETNYLDFQEKGNICYPQPYRVNAKRTLAESELQDLEKPSAQENPKKRRKLTGNEIIKDLSHFAQMNKNAGFKLSARSEIQGSTTQSTENFFTQPPVLKTSQPLDELVAKNTSLEALVSTELHGILKSNTPEPLERHGMRKELPLEEEKIIRFKLPATDLTGENSSETEEVENDMKTKENEEDKASVKHEDISSKVKRKRIVTRSMSTESNESNSSSARAMSDDNFYSPLSSQNNSLVVETKACEANTLAISNTSTVSNIRVELNDGPKPRKPLNSVSMERSLEELKTTLASDKAESTGLQLTAMDRKTCSDFHGSLSIRDSNLSDKHTTLVISSVTSLVSNVKEFMPPISSSKVCETQSKFILKRAETQPKISDYSTIIGGVTYMEETSNKTVGRERTEHNRDKKLLADELDTTLGMTSYDISVFEATSVHANKSLLQQSNEGVEEVITKSVNTTPIKSDIYEDLESETRTETEDSNSLFDEALGLQAKFSPQNSSSSDKQQIPNSVRKKNEDDAIIVLSSEDEQGGSIDSASVEESIEEDADDEDKFKYTSSVETEQTENSLDEVDLEEEEDTIEDDDAELTVDEESLEGTAEDAEDDDNLDYEQDDDENDSNDVDIITEERQEKRDTDEDSEDVRLKNIDDMELYAEELEPQYQDSESSILVENLNDDEKQSSVNQEEEDTCLRVDSDSSTDTNDYENAKFAVQHHVSETDEEVLVVSENLPEELLQIDEDPDDQPSTSAKIVEELRLKALKNNKTDVAELTVSVYEKTSDGIQQIHVKNVDETQKSEEIKHKSGANEQESEKNEQILEGHKQTSDENKYKSEENEQSEPKSEKNKQNSDESKKRGEEKKIMLDEKNLDKQFEEDIKQQHIEANVNKKEENKKSGEHEIDKEEKSNDLLCKKEKEFKEDLKQQIDINVNKTECSKAIAQSLEPNIASNKQIISSDNQRIADKHPSEKLGSGASINHYIEDSQVAKNELVKSRECIPEVIEKSVKLTASDRQGQENALTSNATQKEQSDLCTILEPNETNVLINSSKMGTQQIEEDATVTSTVSTPKRRNVRGTSVPPQSISDEQNSTALDVESTPKRRTVRGKSVPPQSLLVEAITNSGTPIELFFTPLRQNAAVPPEESSASPTPLNTVSTPKRRNRRGTSKPSENQIKEQNSVSPLPTLHTRRAPRAMSVQPKSTLSSEEAQEIDTPTQIHRNTRGTSVPSTTDEHISPKTNQNLRGISVPPVDVTVKIATRRRSVLLDSINEDPAVADSPSTRTRSRARLSSMESELDTPTEEQQPLGKRSRKTSNSSNVSEQLSSTSKRLRRNSVSSQPDTGTPRTTRTRSAVLVQEDSNEEKISAKGTPKRLAMKRKKSADNTPIIKEASEEEIIEAEANDLNLDKEDSIAKDKQNLASPKQEAAAEAPSSYSLSRRLTRTQLAMLEKSAKVTANDLNLRTTPSPPKRVSTRRSSRSTAASVHDSDDAESIASHRSNYSSTTINRRVTRSSVKDKEEMDEELASNASSIGSEKHEKQRSKGFKGSPGTLLTAIPEDDSSESSEQKKRSRRTTKH